jgi:hypothetical protein
VEAIVDMDMDVNVFEVYRIGGCVERGRKADRE